MIFEWDPAKAAKNNRKHKVTFAEAATVFLDALAVTFDDPDHSEAERRFITIGHSIRNRLLFVAHTDRKDRIPYHQRQEGDAKGNTWLRRRLVLDDQMTFGASTSSPSSRTHAEASTMQRRSRDRISSCSMPTWRRHSLRPKPSTRLFASWSRLREPRFASAGKHDVLLDRRLVSPELFDD
ncbi:MAG TPA: BrnT family toxin [Planctomycetota bacterium]|nr:BrnT family toxin [Planctomycetota bacterium]